MHTYVLCKMAWLVALAVKRGGGGDEREGTRRKSCCVPGFWLDVNAVVVLPATAIDKLTAPTAPWRSGCAWSLVMPLVCFALMLLI